MHRILNATVTGIDPHRLMQIVADALDRSDDVLAVVEQVGPSLDDLRFLGVNDAFCRMTGYSLAEVVGHPFSMLACPGTSPDLAAKLTAAIAARRSLRTEMLCANAAGKEFWFGLHLMPAGEAGAEGPYFVVLGRDISAQLQASQQQRAIQELLANVFLSVDAAVAIVGADGRFLMTNPQHDRLMRRPVGSLAGKPTQDCVAPEFRAPLEQARKQQFIDGKNFTIDVQALGGDGTAIALRLTSAAITRADLPRCRIVTVTELPPPPTPPDVQVAGKIKLVGLEEVRAALGPQWEAMAERALSSAEHVIQRRLGPADTYSRTQDQGFLICFAGMTEQEASFRAAMIGREIRARLIGQGEDPASTQVSAITTSVKMEGQDRSPDTMRNLLEERLNGRRAAIEAEARQTLLDAVQSATCQLEAIHGRTGSEAVARYACLPVALERKIAAAMSVLPSGGGGGADFDLDALMLSLAAERSMHDALHGTAAMILVNVSFDSFMTRSRTDRYVELCNKLDLKLRQRLVLVLSQVPPSIGRSRVLDCANRLRPFCRGVGFEVEDIELPQVDLSLTGAPIVSINAERWGGGGGMQEHRLTQMLRALHTHRGRLLMRRVPSWDVATQMRGLGVDLVSVEAG